MRRRPEKACRPRVNRQPQVSDTAWGRCGPPRPGLTGDVQRIAAWDHAVAFHATRIIAHSTIFISHTMRGAYSAGWMYSLERSRAAYDHDEEPQPAQRVGRAEEYAVRLERATRGLLALNVSVLEHMEISVGLAPLRALQSLDRRGPSMVGELGDDLGLVPSTASRLSDRLAEAGLITRRPAPSNRRSTLLELTDAGRAILDRTGRATHPRVRRGRRPDDQPRSRRAHSGRPCIHRRAATIVRQEQSAPRRVPPTQRSALNVDSNEGVVRGDRLADDQGRQVPASSVCLTASALLGTAYSTSPPISSEHGNELAFLEAGACTREGHEVSCGQKGHPGVLIIARTKAAQGQTVWGSNVLARG